MSPRKQPGSLLDLCVKKSLCLINSACYFIEKNYPENQYAECEKEVFALKSYLMSALPARLFDILCSDRTCMQYRGDPRIQLMAITHPKMTVFRKCDLDNSIPHLFWVDMLAGFNHLKVLDLKFLCSDEILEVIGRDCPMLEEVNIVSRVDICKSLFNASVLIRNVSDEGLLSIAKLKNLKILTMDPPRNERVHKIGRCVSQAGIITLICNLPNLQELKIDTCDIGMTLLSTKLEIGPLSLQKVNCHFASGNGIKKLLKICPNLKDLSVTQLSEDDKDAIMDEITASEVILSRINLSFFTFNSAVREMLSIKGQYLTHFSLWEADFSLNFDVILCIGSCCPNLDTLCIGTQSPSLDVPYNFTKKELMFTKLQILTLGNGNFSIENLLNFFCSCTDILQRLVLKYQTKTNIDAIVLYLLQKGSLRQLCYLWLDCTLDLSDEVVIELIKSCENLQMFTMDFGLHMATFQKYITENNYDLRIGSY